MKDVTLSIFFRITIDKPNLNEIIPIPFDLQDEKNERNIIFIPNIEH